MRLFRPGGGGEGDHPVAPGALQEQGGPVEVTEGGDGKVGERRQEAGVRDSQIPH